MIVKKGEIYFADLSDVIGSEQGGIRPVLIIQNDIGNRFAPTVIVATITSAINKKKQPTHVELSGEEYGFKKDVVILLEQVRTIDKTRLSHKVTIIDNKKMDEVSRAYQIAGGIITDFQNQEVVNQYKFILGESVEMMEDHEYEFKETSHNPPREIIKKNVAENTVSFLNSHGGRIFYGISNDRIVKGLAATPEEIDDIQKLIHDRLRKIEPAVSGNRYTINFHEVYDKNSNIVNDVYILEIVVPVPTVYERHNIYFSDGKYLYVRLKGAKHKLTGPETVSFIQDKLTKKELDHEI